MQKKTLIVISGINIVDGGPLSVMKDFLLVISKMRNTSFRVIALVNSKKLFDFPNIEYLEFPKSKKNWLNRLYYEYYYFKKLSRALEPDYWISMHDISPNIVCKNQYVYCHNATPYFTPSWKDWIYGTSPSIFSLFYIYLYQINIRKNKAVIVQQDWLRKEFEKRFNLKNVIVAYPDINKDFFANINSEIKLEDDCKKLFFPSFPRSFKNFEIICEAYMKLSTDYQKKLQIYLTIEKGLNSYSKFIFNKYEHLEGVHMIGLIKRQEVFQYYNEVDGLIFPSKLESWGLPITEFKKLNKTIFLSDLPYAKETLGNYDNGYFFSPTDSSELACLMKLFIDDKLPSVYNTGIKIQQPFFIGWAALFNYLLNDSKDK